MRKSLLLTAFLLCPLFSQDSTLVERLLASGEKAMAAGNSAEALDSWAQVLTQSPKSEAAARALLLMARHHAASEKAEAAYPLIEQLRADHLQTNWAGEGLLLRARILAQRARKGSDLKECIAECNRVSDLFPDQPLAAQAQLQLGQALARQGQLARSYGALIHSLRLAPKGETAPDALFEAGEVLDRMGDLEGCLRTHQSLREDFPSSPEAQEAAWRMLVRVRHRIQRAPLKSTGPWPQGRTKWLKTPTLLATGPQGELHIYQNEAGASFRLEGQQLLPEGTATPDAKALLVHPQGKVVLLSAKTGLGQGPLPGVQSPSSMMLDGWGWTWICDAKAGALTMLAPEGQSRSLPSPATVAAASMPGGGGVLASDANRSLLFLNSEGQLIRDLPYGKGLPAPFKTVRALASDGAGHVAALVEDGDFEGVVLYGPEGSPLRFATLKQLGIAGRFRGIALDRQGGIILSDRSNDLLIRLQ